MHSYRGNDAIFRSVAKCTMNELLEQIVTLLYWSRYIIIEFRTFQTFFAIKLSIAYVERILPYSVHECKVDVLSTIRILILIQWHRTSRRYSITHRYKHIHRQLLNCEITSKSSHRMRSFSTSEMYHFWH